jgi:pimeloyl-ACP methyl ester carboxylesterase
VLVDLAAWVKDAKESRGYEKVVLVGWSGGGSLSLFYQAQAERTTIAATAAGDPLDLQAAGLIPADGIVFIAAHLSRAETLTEWLDPSVLDEADPDRRDAEFDIYDAACPNKPPFAPEFVAAFRAAQRARSRRITDRCLDQLDTLRRRGGSEIERAFVVHRTMCDVRWIDPAVDPNQRRPNWCYQGNPATVNTSPVGLARYSSLRSWISQWSFDASLSKSATNAPKVARTPVLQVENMADDAVPATHNPQVHAFLATPDKTHVRIDGATHYYLDQPAQLGECIRLVPDWCEARRLHG